MDNFIHNKESGLERYVKLGLTNLWVVKAQNDAAENVLAMFALSKSSLVLSSYDLNVVKRGGVDIDEEIILARDAYPAVEIDYLAISTDCRNQGLGEFIIAEISRRISEDKLSATMFIIVQAYDTSKYSAVEFYKSCGFNYSDHGLLKVQNQMMYGEVPDTKLMFKLLYN